MKLYDKSPLYPIILFNFQSEILFPSWIFCFEISNNDQQFLAFLKMRTCLETKMLLDLQLQYFVPILIVFLI